MRSLNPDEQALWARVTATINPLSRDKNDSQPVETSRFSLSETKPSEPPPTAPRATARAPRSFAEATLDGNWDRRLRVGSVEPDRVIDLHGHGLDSAWRAIDDGIARAIDRGERVVLLITGHHRPGDRAVERGKIRAVVNDWLAASAHGPRIAAVRGAHRRHGGGGSLYVILRRR